MSSLYAVYLRGLVEQDQEDPTRFEQWSVIRPDGQRVLYGDQSYIASGEVLRDVPGGRIQRRPVTVGYGPWTSPEQAHRADQPWYTVAGLVLAPRLLAVATVFEGACQPVHTAQHTSAGFPRYLLTVPAASAAEAELMALTDVANPPRSPQQ